MKRTKALTVAMAIALGGVLGACGSSSGTKALSKAEWIKQADALCKANDPASNKVFDKLNSSATKDEAAKVLKDDYLPLLDDLIVGIGKLPAGSDFKSDTKDLLNELTDLSDSIAKDPVAVIGGGDPFAKATKMAKDLGLEECGQANGGAGDTTSDTTAPGDTTATSDSTAPGDTSGASGSVPLDGTALGAILGESIAKGMGITLSTDQQKCVGDGILKAFGGLDGITKMGNGTPSADQIQKIFGVFSDCKVDISGAITPTS